MSALCMKAFVHTTKSCRFLFLAIDLGICQQIGVHNTLSFILTHNQRFVMFCFDGRSVPVSDAYFLLIFIIPLSCTTDPGKSNCNLNSLGSYSYNSTGYLHMFRILA